VTAQSSWILRFRSVLTPFSGSRIVSLLLDSLASCFLAWRVFEWDFGIRLLSVFPSIIGCCCWCQFFWCVVFRLFSVTLRFGVPYVICMIEYDEYLMRCATVGSSLPPWQVGFMLSIPYSLLFLVPFALAPIRRPRSTPH